MRRTKLLFSSILATVLGMGVIGGVVAAKNTESKPVEKVGAATSTTLYYAISSTDVGSYTVKCNVNRKGDGDDYAQYTMAKQSGTYHGLKIYKSTFTDLYDGLGCIQFQLYSGSTWISQDQPFGPRSWTSASTYNGKMWVHGQTGWKTYSTDPSTTSKTLYIDATNWSSIGSNTPKCHYWIDWGDGNSTSYNDVDGANITAVSGGGTYSNKKWWSFTINPNGTSGLKFLFMYNNYSMQTADISYSASYNAYYVSGTKSAAPESSFTSNGTIYTIQKYKKLGSGSSTLIGTDYLLGGESYQVPAIPSAETGYSAPSQWCSTEAGGNPKYSKDAWISNVTENKTLYALYTAATYNIVYDRNLNDGGATVTQVKNYGTSVTLYTPKTGALSAARWNPSFAKRFLYWNTDWSDKTSTGRKNAGSTYTTNSGATLYYIETWWNFRYKSDSDSDWITLVENDDGLDTSNYKVQFAPESAHVLNHGDKLYFQYSSNGGTDWSDLTVTTYSGSNNNYDTSTGIKLTTTDTIFLKINNSNVYDCWVPGITDYTIRVNSTDTYSMVGAGTSGGGKEQMKATALVYGIKDQLLDIGYQGGYYRGYRNGGCAGIEERNNNLYFTITGMYEVYLIKQDDVHWDNIYVSIDDSASAEKWGEVFMATVGCDASGVNLPSGWSSNVSYYPNLNSATKNIIYAASANPSASAPMLNQAIARYETAIRNHPSLTKFITNGSGTIRAVSMRTSPLHMISSEANSGALIVIVIGATSITAIGGYFFIRRKKQK